MHGKISYRLRGKLRTKQVKIRPWGICKIVYATIKISSFILCLGILLLLFVQFSSIDGKADLSLILFVHVLFSSLFLLFDKVFGYNMLSKFGISAFWYAQESLELTEKKIRLEYMSNVQRRAREVWSLKYGNVQTAIYDEADGVLILEGKLRGSTQSLEQSGHSICKGDAGEIRIHTYYKNFDEIYKFIESKISCEIKR